MTPITVATRNDRILAGANAGETMLGRNEVVNQIFHRELRALLAGGR